MTIKSSNSKEHTVDFPLNIVSDKTQIQEVANNNQGNNQNELLPVVSSNN